jgi:hypothetical protein
VEPIPRNDPTIPDPTPLDDPRPSQPGKTRMSFPLDRQIERVIEIVETRLH